MMSELGGDGPVEELAQGFSRAGLSGADDDHPRVQAVREQFELAGRNAGQCMNALRDTRVG